MGKPPPPALKPQQARFCEEYIKDLNATQAAVRAGYSEKTAQEQSSRLLSNVMVREQIDALKKARSGRTEITADTILRELLKLATVDIGKAYDANGNLLNVHDMPSSVRRAIAGIKVFEEFEGYGRDRTKVGEVREVKFWDKTRALELLGKHLKLFTEKHELSGKFTLEDLVAGSNTKDDSDGE